MSGESQSEASAAFAIQYRPAGIRVAPRQHQIWVHDRPVRLTVLQFKMLCLLLARCGEVVTFDELSREVWGYPSLGDHGYVDTTVWRLRRALRAAGADDVIQSVRSVGYRVPETELDERDPIESTVFESLQTGILILDGTNRIRSANRAFRRLVGYERAELLQLPSYTALVPGAKALEYERDVRRVFGGQSSDWGPMLARHRDGHLVEIDVCAEPLEEGGRIVGVLAEVRPL